MKFLQALMVIGLVLLAIFTVANFDALMAPHTLNLFWISSYMVPMGILLVILIALITIGYALAVTFIDLRSKAEINRYLKQMEQMRTAIDQAEASRFTQLREYIDQQMAGLASRVESRVDRVRDELAADIGQLEDAVFRKGHDPREREL
ncbi:LapA family protein [Deinococcus roseus]|uniref:Lipopolysaccharide assembly protein A domain-containing protein n=1 Tax=Deinococcus roseus TaxID=392414 RepID=A0ABQ2DI28_9DEIO|nr:LapA family protein [Deinococcus roseus]GGJ58879.1 hypothetical protein GCM10008938_51170 [Deinococcus roseus]